MKDLELAGKGQKCGEYSKIDGYSTTQVEGVMYLREEVDSSEYKIMEEEK